jgi:DNA polymerase-3 subunit delta'
MSWDLVGHEWAVSLLKSHIERDQMRHAYLITGPKGVGRRTLALRLTQALNCENPAAVGEPCRTCRICRQIENMQHADLFVVQPEEAGGVLKVDQIRELQHSLSLHPYEARYKVALLLHFEQANHYAMNALLKTLEEPAASVIILLTADSTDNVLPTIASRCEILRLRPAPLEALAAALHEQTAIPAEECRLLSHIAGGCPGTALDLARQPEILQDRAELLADLVRVLAADTTERFVYAERVSKNRERLRSILVIWQSFWRDVLIQSAHASVPSFNMDVQALVDQAAAGLDVLSASQIVRTFERSSDLLDRNVNVRLIAEVLMLKLPRLRLQQPDSLRF